MKNSSVSSFFAIFAILVGKGSAPHFGTKTCGLGHIGASAGPILLILSAECIEKGTRNGIVYFKLSLELFLIVQSDPPTWVLRGVSSQNPTKG